MLRNISPSRTYVFIDETTEARHQATVLDHESHQSGWISSKTGIISSNAEELRILLLDKLLEGLMSCQTYTMI